MIDWTLHIESTPEILYGKPVIRNTRIPVDLILEKLAAGDTNEDLLDAYPKITRDDIAACLLFAAESIKNEIIKIDNQNIQLNQQVDQANIHISQLNEQINQSNEQIKQLISQREDLLNRIKESEEEIISYVLSTSWQVTRPLRKISYMLHRGK